MSLNIKNDRTERLARSVAEEAGETVATAIDRALEERLERLRQRNRPAALALAERLRQISERCAALPERDPRPADEILGYDDRGLFG